MRKIIYYVAISIDGFIEGKNGDISGFASSGKGVEKYLSDLQDFDTVIMGRKTYTFGYQFGLKAGQPAYPHMQHYIFSNTLSFENPHEKVQVCKPYDTSLIEALKQEEGTDIYLCGGGRFAGWLLENELIDVLKVKLNPLILGEGTRLFGNSTKQYQLKLVKGEGFESGLQILTYEVVY